MRISYSDHLVALVADAEAAAARIAVADADRRRRLADASRRTAARLSARLDGSPLDDATADAVDARERAGAPTPPAAIAPPDVPVPDVPVPDVPVPDAPVPDGIADADGRRADGWAQALRIDAGRLDTMATQELAAVEYANLLAAADVEVELADVLLERPAEALTTLHGIVVRDLVAPDVAGRPRRTAQAVHDGAQGMVLYNAPAPEAVPALIEALARWLEGEVPDGWDRSSAGMPALVVAGVVHERILQWQPFEAANGRVARAASRMVLRARGLDPDGVAVPEAGYAADPGAYYGEVAATMRRREDLGPWLERSAEATVTALEVAARALAPPGDGAPPAITAAAAVLDPVAELLDADGRVTVGDYMARAGVSRHVASLRLRGLARDGVLLREPGTRGLRYRGA